MKLVVSEIFNGPHKITLPESALSELSPSDLESPLIYKVGTTHAGVLEFSAQEGTAKLGRTLADQLGYSVGDRITIERADLPKGSSVTLKADTELDWKPILEAWLPSNYTALTKGDTITVAHMGSVNQLQVVEIEPSDAVCIIDTDMDLLVQTPSTLGAGEATPTEEFALEKLLVLGQLPITTDLTFPTTYSFKVQGVAYIGPQYATSPRSYLYKITDEQTTLELDPSVLRNKLAIVGHGSVTVSSSTLPAVESENDDTTNSNQAECSHCHRHVSKQTLPMHEAFCYRNNAVCATCGDVFLKQIPADHWHCQICGAHGTGTAAETEHGAEHVSETCECGFTGEGAAVANHRASDCPNRLISCQFCHLVLPQGDASAAEKAQGVTAHEAYCGSKTVDCPVCRKHVRQSEIAAHMDIHESARRSRPAPRLCSNKNCPHTVQDSTAHLGLCSNCYGTVYTAQHDPDGSKLRSRVERKYVIQLSRGCGNSWCNNQYCATGSGLPRKMAEIMPVVRELMTGSDIYFCVDQVTAKKAMFLYDDDLYTREWRGKAISETSSEADAAQWLKLNAPRLGEVH